MNVVLLLKKYFLWKIRKITSVSYTHLRAHENKEDYVGYEDQELCNRYYKEAEVMRQKQDWSRLRAVPAPAKGTPSPGWGQLGRGNEVRVKYVSINSGLGGDRL